MKDKVREQMRTIAAARLRKALSWAQMQGNPPDANFLKQVIPTGAWRVWNMRLLDWLTDELHLPQEQAIDLTEDAIREGYEDGKLYGIDPVNEEPA